MKNLLLQLLIITIFSFNSFGQNDVTVLNGYEYVYVPNLKYKNGSNDVWNIVSKVKLTLNDKGFQIITKTTYNGLGFLKNKALVVSVNHSRICEGCGVKKVTLKFYNSRGEIVYISKGKGLCLVGLQCEVNKATKKALKKIKDLNYKFDKSKIDVINYPEVEKSNETEKSLKEYYASNKLDNIEGIYKSYQDNVMSSSYKIGIKKKDDKYIAIILDVEKKTGNPWNKGEVKAYFEPSSMNNFYSVKWLMGNKTENNTFASIENNTILSIEFNNPKTKEKIISKFIKMYPNSIEKKSNSYVSKSFGSGFFLTKNGIIATNAHVVDNAKSIKIQINNEVGKINYNAKLLLVDNKNDVALLKIDDENFKELSLIPYSFIENADVGEKTFTIGFPLKNLMGNNYKLTNGIISSTTGVSNDLRYYQISVPLQPGNSGGPLFNENGNIIGITTARLNEKSAGTNIENVNYAIKISYLLNLYNMLPENIDLNKIPSTKKELKEQVKVLKNYVCLIKVND